MITRELYQYLKQDAKLAALMGGEARLFPNIIHAGSEPPFICYRSAGAAQDDCPLREETVAFDITAGDYAAAESIGNRLAELFDPCAPARIETQGWTLLHARPAACADSADELGRHVKTVAFTFKFLKKGAL
ncbi:MAG: hypothetical protein GX410_02450 [Elusimicrobia bacterium]|nr:hypothetical protein [Elusimicrobiota bacterium]